VILALSLGMNRGDVGISSVDGMGFMHHLTGNAGAQEP
jgi:hypothetical protein